MGAWILIVMMFGGNGAAATYVPGFWSKDACEEAKVAVEATAEKFAGFPKAVCVVTTGSRAR